MTTQDASQEGRVKGRDKSEECEARPPGERDHHVCMKRKGHRGAHRCAHKEWRR